MPFERPPTPPNDENFHEFARQYHESSAGKAQIERMGTEAKDAASHAENWIKGTAHLWDEDQLAKGHKIVREGRRGIATGPDINQAMGRVFGASYPEFDPSDVQMTIPDHLGEQFR